MPKTLRQKKRGNFSYRRNAKILRKRSVRGKRSVLHRLSVRRRQSVRRRSLIHRKKIRGGKIIKDDLDSIDKQIEDFKQLFVKETFTWVHWDIDKLLKNYYERDETWTYLSFYNLKPAVTPTPPERVSEIYKKFRRTPNTPKTVSRPTSEFDVLKRLQEVIDSEEARILKDSIKTYLNPDNLKEFENSANLPESLAKCLNQFQNVDFKFERSDGEYYAEIDTPQQYYITIPILTYICNKYVKNSEYIRQDADGERKFDFFENFQKFITDYNANAENEKIINKTQFLQSTKHETDFFPLPDLLSEFDFTEKAAERLWKLFYDVYPHPTIVETQNFENNKKEYADRIKKKKDQIEKERRDVEHYWSQTDQYGRR